MINSTSDINLNFNIIWNNDKEEYQKIYPMKGGASNKKYEYIKYDPYNMTYIELKNSIALEWNKLYEKPMNFIFIAKLIPEYLDIKQLNTATNFDVYKITYSKIKHILIKIVITPKTLQKVIKILEKDDMISMIISWQIISESYRYKTLII